MDHVMNWPEAFSAAAASLALAAVIIVFIIKA